MPMLVHAATARTDRGDRWANPFPIMRCPFIMTLMKEFENLGDEGRPRMGYNFFMLKDSGYNFEGHLLMEPPLTLLNCKIRFRVIIDFFLLVL